MNNQTLNKLVRAIDDVNADFLLGNLGHPDDLPAEMLYGDYPETVDHAIIVPWTNGGVKREVVRVATEVYLVSSDDYGRSHTNFRKRFDSVAKAKRAYTRMCRRECASARRYFATLTAEEKAGAMI